MQSPFKRIVVYDLETGGFSEAFNSITEIAVVVVDLEELSIVHESSVLLKPYLDLSSIEEDSYKEAKRLYSSLSQKDLETETKGLKFKDQIITLKNIRELQPELEAFRALVIEEPFFKYKDFSEFKGHELEHVFNLYVDFCYNPQALDVTKISLDLLIKEGLEYEAAFEHVLKVIIEHTLGNNKPVLAGHNIKKFDNPFFEKFFTNNSKDLRKLVSTLEIDTLELARLKWFELPSFNLGTCANEVGLTLKEAHRALPDTIANAKVLIKMLKSLRGEGSQKSTYQRRKFNFNF